MIKHVHILTALRARLLSLLVVDTGSVVLGATESGYTRSEGSFILDGFREGMEVVPEGFDHTIPAVITRVDDLSMDVSFAHAVSPEVAGRRLYVGLPPDRAWENTVHEPTDGRWYVEEDYIPGPSGLATGLDLDLEPAYVLRLYGIAGVGTGAISEVGDAIVGLFPAGSWFPADDGVHTVHIRLNPAPYRGQVVSETASHALTVITVPLWVRTRNNP